MKYEEFTELVNILKKQYGNIGEKWFTPLRSDMYYTKLKYYPYKEVEKLFKDYVANHSYVPKLNDIKELVKYVQKEDEVPDKDFKCDKCKSSGFISYYNKDYEAFSYRCDCAKGQSFNKMIPFYTKRHPDHFYDHDEYMKAMFEKFVSNKS